MRGARGRRVPWVFLSCLCSCLLWPVVPGVSLLPYGPSVGDREFVERTTDFTSPLFRPQIGFLLGSSLRDYLYFTDNGQIIFPESEYQIFSYPNPPLRGFTGRDPVAMVAPFWDDADFSSGQGTIFYQEYDTLYHEHNLLVQQVESWINKFTDTRNYKAEWTLKVTWVNAPAYPAGRTFGTSTYQAILSTDGSRSYALFLYQSGGMQWDVTQRPGNPVLMGFSSGDGLCGHSALSSGPTWKRYQPDRLLNTHTGNSAPHTWLDPKCPLSSATRRGGPRAAAPSVSSIPRGAPDRAAPLVKPQYIMSRCVLLDLRAPYSLLAVGVCTMQLTVKGQFKFDPPAGFLPSSPFRGWHPGSEEASSASRGFWKLHKGARLKRVPSLDWLSREAEAVAEGLRGLQLYSLHQEERPNYRLRCLQWLKTQPQWPTWGWNQVSCPCSWQQGLWDLRFQPSSIGWWGLGSRQLCSFSSWRGGVCCSYGPWGELLQGWRVHDPWQFGQELEPQNWCCRWSDQPMLCALYRQRRPHVGCAGYRPPRPAWMFGDPHITTLDGANYTFNGLGDFQLVRAWDGNSSFLLLGRTAQTGSARATNFIAFAASYEARSLSPVTVRWLLEPNDTVRVQVNNQTVTFETQHEGRETFNSTGVTVTRAGSVVSAAFDGAVAVSVRALSNILHASCGLPAEYLQRTEGLLGVWNGNPGDDFRMPNGSTIPGNSSEASLFHYGMTWKTNDTGLLGERGDHPPSNFTPDFLTSLQKNKTLNEMLLSKCHEDERCIYDKNGTLLWTPKSLEPFTLEILARNVKVNLSSVLQPRTVVCACKDRSQCLYNQTGWVGNSSLEVARCRCGSSTFGHYCERSRDQCEAPCFAGVACVPGRGCEACPPHLTGDGRHCAALAPGLHCGNRSCPASYCYNRGHCHVSPERDCQPACTCHPAFSDSRCLVAGNPFTPAAPAGLPVMLIQLWLSEEENASVADVNASVAYRLGNLNVRAFLQNSEVLQINSSAAPASGSLRRHWRVFSKFQYLPQGPVIDFLNTKLLDAVVEAFLPQASWWRKNRSGRPRTDVNFHSISREDVHSVLALNVSTLKAYFKCNSYKDYRLVYSPQSGFTCVSPCSEGYCKHGGQCQHLPQGPRCSCVPFSIYTPWGERCEHLGMKLGAFFGILFGALFILLLLGAVGFAVLYFWRFWRYSPGNHYSHRLDSEG
ncbi:mucin-4 [Lycaon pictus]